MPNLGGAELLFVLIVIILLFGRGRISGIAGEMGEAVNSFRRGLAKDKVETTNTTESSETTS